MRQQPGLAQLLGDAVLQAGVGRDVKSAQELIASAAAVRLRALLGAVLIGAAGPKRTRGSSDIAALLYRAYRQIQAHILSGSCSTTALGLIPCSVLHSHGLHDEPARPVTSSVIRHAVSCSMQHLLRARVPL